MQCNYGISYFKDKSVLNDLQFGKLNRRKKKKKSETFR